MAIVIEAARPARELGVWALEPDSLVHSLPATLPISSVPQFPFLYKRGDNNSLTALLLNE